VILTKFVVKSGATTVYTKAISLSKSNTSQILNFNLPANSVGVKSYRATVAPIAKEKNKTNNSRNFAVEVVDEKTNVALVSNIMHPDLGAIKKSIESNEQRKVSILKPQEANLKINDFQLVIAYQPNNSFKDLFGSLEAQNKNKFLITGPKTDWRFLNSVNQHYLQEINNQSEEYQAIQNVNYNGSINTEEPLLATFETNGKREAILLGENIWKWRAQSYVNNKSFNNFDNFIGKLVQYLASNKRKNRLNLDYESFYQGNNNVIVTAQFFNKNYEFDATESLNITVRDKVSKETRTFPLILKNNNYQADLSSLAASDYSFTVKATSESISKSGNFRIIEYNVEQQFLNADVKKLRKIANNSNGGSYFTNNYNTLFDNLLNNENYKPIQKSSKNIVPLIDWKYLLGLIALTLAIEWFMRKYNGLI